MCVYSGNPGARIHARLVSPVPIWRPHNPPYLIRRCQFMSAGGFDVMVEQFNNVHFHAFPNSTSLLSLFLSPTGDHTVYWKDREAVARNGTKEEEKACMCERENCVRRIITVDLYKFARLQANNSRCLIFNFAVCLVNAHITKTNIQVSSIARSLPPAIHILFFPQVKENTCKRMTQGWIPRKLIFTRHNLFNFKYIHWNRTIYIKSCAHVIDRLMFH